MCGAMAVNGEDGGEPLKMGESMADLAGGLFASWSILAALLRRERTGEGATLDVAMHDALFALLPTAQAQLLYGGREPRRVGNRHPLSTPFGCFAAKDGLFALCVLNERHFAKLSTLIGQAGLEHDPRFNSDSLRTENEPALKALIESWSSSLSADEAVATLGAAGLTAAPIRSFGAAAASEQAFARQLVKEVPHPVLAHAPTVPQPVWFDGVKHASERGAPALGADRDSILKDMA